MRRTESSSQGYRLTAASLPCPRAGKGTALLIVEPISCGGVHPLVPDGYLHGKPEGVGTHFCVAQARESFPWAETLETKRGLGWNAAVSLHPKAACDMIADEKNAAEALVNPREAGFAPAAQNNPAPGIQLVIIQI